MENNRDFIIVPPSEWSEVKEQLVNISKSLLELKGKDKPDFYKIPEAMNMLRCCRNTLKSYIERGDLEVIKMNPKKYSRGLIPRADIERLIESKRSNT